MPINFDINDFEIKKVAKTLSIDATGISQDAANVYYQLKDEVGNVIEAGNKTFPLQALAIVTTQPIDKNALNQLLKQFKGMSLRNEASE